MKTKTHILLVALTSTVLSSGNAHALDFSAAKKFFNSAKTTVTNTVNSVNAYVEKNTLETRLTSEDTVKNAEKLLAMEKETGNAVRIKSAEDLLKYAKMIHENNAKAYEYSTKVSESINKKTEVELPTTSTSMIKLEGDVPADSQWILFEVSKENFYKKITMKVENTHYEKNLPIEGGAGTYKINVFASKETKQANSEYKYVGVHKIINTDTRDMKYLLPTEYAQSDDQRIIQAAQQITSGANTDAEKIAKIYQYVTETVKYDYDAFYKGTYINKAYDAVTILENPMAFCSGYANLVTALSRAAGIKARVVMGKIERDGQRLGHAWNEVFVDGEWKILDSTWDIDRVEYKYYFISKEEFANDHFEGVVNDIY